jgi:hypothetical protein
VEDFLFERRETLNNFFSSLYLCLSDAPYATHFYLTYSKDLIRNDKGKAGYEQELELLRRTLKNIRDEDIEVFLHYNTEVAVQIVNDLIDEPAHQSHRSSSLSTAIDKETRGLAQRVKKCPHYKSYKNYFSSVSGSGLKNI